MQSAIKLYIQFQMWDADGVDRSMGNELPFGRTWSKGMNEEDEWYEEAQRRDAVAKKRERTRKSELYF